MVFMIVFFDDRPIARAAKSMGEVQSDAETLVSEGQLVAFCDDIDEARLRLGEIEISNPERIIEIQTEAGLND